ncbi:hypothetical protein EP7_003689 [Isosphaeraceae bacterium EP7]
MSGPIIRKYGFPNFEEIFGKREMKHGVDPAEASKPQSTKDEPSKPVPTVGEDAGVKKPN